MRASALQITSWWMALSFSKRFQTLWTRLTSMPHLQELAVFWAMQINVMRYNLLYIMLCKEGGGPQGEFFFDCSLAAALKMCQDFNVMN